MSLLIAALLISSASNPPPEDDDKPRAAASSKEVPPAIDDDDEQAKAAPSSKQVPPSSDEDDDAEGGTQAKSAIVVTARRLDAARSEIDAALGSSVYSLTNDTIENRPGGETGRIADILSQAPGVTLSSRGLSIRGAAANQVRINNVIIPEAISDPAEQLSSRLAETTRLITGTLPAQFGFAPAGIISVTTKNGLYSHGGQAEFFAGTQGMIEPAFEWAGSVSGTSLFASGDLDRDRSRVADESGIRALDRRTDIGGLGFADHVIDANDRVSLVFGGSREREEISRTGIGPGTEIGSNGYAVGTFQHSNGGFTLQASVFGGLSADRYRFLRTSRERTRSVGTQIDASKAIGTSQTLRFGILTDHSAVHELGLAGDGSDASRTSVALYGQDEWTFAKSLTFNPGVRVEWLRGFRRGATPEPRASLVWQDANGFSAHVGYARYASAPPLGEVAPGIALRNERDDMFDAGLQEKLGSLTLGADSYLRSAHDFISKHDTLGSAVPGTFAFKRARFEGVELSATYAHKSISAWANLSLSKARAKTIIGGEELFTPEAIAAASKRFVPLSSDRPVTLTGGVVQRFGKLSLGGDLLVSSGSVRTLDSSDPNGSRHSSYALLGLSAVYHSRIAGQPADLRVDLTNLTNVSYALGDASNLEGGWTRWGRGRAIMIGIEQGF